MILTARNDHRIEAGFDDISDVRQFINNWKDALQDKSFYEAKAAREARIIAAIVETRTLMDEIITLLKEEWDNR